MIIFKCICAYAHDYTLVLNKVMVKLIFEVIYLLLKICNYNKIVTQKLRL